MSQTTTPKNRAPAKRAVSKIDKVIALMRRKNGASLDEMVHATGWLPHTTHAALSGLRKKGCDITRTKSDGVEYRGERYASLSAVARKITGARWSGPRFFGLGCPRLGVLGVTPDG